MNELEKYIYEEYSVEKMINTSLNAIVRKHNSWDWPTDWEAQGRLRERMRVNIISAIRTSLIETGQLRIHYLSDVEENESTNNQVND